MQNFNLIALLLVEVEIDFFIEDRCLFMSRVEHSSQVIEELFENDVQGLASQVGFDRLLPLSRGLVGGVRPGEQQQTVLQQKLFEAMEVQFRDHILPLEYFDIDIFDQFDDFVLVSHEG